MRRSITAKILLTIAVVLIVTDLGLLGLGLSTVYRTIHQNYISYARASAAVAANLLDGADIQRLQTDQAYAGQYQNVLQELCRTNDLEYLYIYIPNIEQETIQFVMIIYGEGSQAVAAEERVPGTIVQYILTESELQAWSGNDVESIEELDNKYGHVLTAYSAIHDNSGNISALVGADVSIDETMHIFFLRYRIMLIAIAISFVLVLGTLAAILKTSVLKPAEIISHRMKTFVTDRQSKFEKIKIKGKDEFAQMAESFNSMAEEIDQYVKNINELTEEKHRQEAEIHIAKNIQLGFLPDGHFELPESGVYLKAVMIPAKYVGGDFYDYFSLTEHTLCLVIADVSGKGISAALFMARAITVVRQYAKLGYSPAEILFYTNNALSANNPEQMFLTAFVGILNSDTGKLIYANGGHNPPYLISNKLHHLDSANGLPIGLFEDEEYQETEIKIKPGDTIFLYTDGVNEAVSSNGEFFGILRLENLLKQKDQENCIEIVLNAVKDFARDTQQSDDITMLACSISADFSSSSSSSPDSHNSHIRIKADLANLTQVHHLILDHPKIPEISQKQLCLMAEEIFVNICSYAYKDQSKPGDIDISIQVIEPSGEIRMIFCDWGTPFDPRENALNIDDYNMDEQIGGLGRFIAFDLADKVDYEYNNQQNQLTIVKYLKEETT